MPGPAPQPPTLERPAAGPPAAPRPPSLALRNVCAWLVLLPLTGAVVVRAVRGHHPHEWDALAQRAPRAVADGAAYALLALVAAAALHALLRRGALWVVLVAVLAGTYFAFDRWWDGGRAPTRAWVWVPFAVLVGVAAMHDVPRAVREAAAVDRAGPWLTFRSITLPLAAPLVCAGGVFVLAAVVFPPDALEFIVAHALLVLAVVVDALLRRGRE